MFQGAFRWQWCRWCWGPAGGVGVLGPAGDVGASGPSVGVGVVRGGRCIGA